MNYSVTLKHLKLHYSSLLITGLMLATVHFEVLPDNIHKESVVNRIHTLGGLDQGHSDSTFFIANLKLALSQTEHDFGEYKLSHETLPMNPLREFKSLGSGKLDVIWTMTSKYRESISIPVRIPLTYGLFGYRLLVTKPSEQHFSSHGIQLRDLKNKLAAQGPGWPDTEILRHNNFKVYTPSDTSDIYQLLSKGSVDYFPRSVLKSIESLGRKMVAFI